MDRTFSEIALDVLLRLVIRQEYPRTPFKSAPLAKCKALTNFLECLANLKIKDDFVFAQRPLCKTLMYLATMVPLSRPIAVC